MSFILGKKIGMAQIFNEDGTVVPVTIIEAGPVTVTQIKNKEKDGYKAIQFGFDNKKNISRPKAGHLKGLNNFRFLKETRVIDEKLGEMKRGDAIDVSSFNLGDIVKVSGLSKAKGFQGAVKRHGFSGAPASHGHKKMLRRPGSIGQRFPQHTLKGMRMAGRMGGVNKTVRGLTVINVDKESNLLAIKGAVPGRRGTLLEITKTS